jgi:predicted phage-related endonuclease
MQIHNVKQGSPEWQKLRTEYFTASEAPAMMGVGYITRNDLLKQKATGLVPEITPAQAAIFARGHGTEASFRPVASVVVGEPLYPITASIEIDGLKLLASSDGMTMGGETGFEHKLYNAELAAMIERDGEPGPRWYWQLEQQLLVLGAERILFATSNGTSSQSSYCWYTSKPERRAALLAGWKQFAEDLAAYRNQDVTPQLKGVSTVAGLPALVVDISGDVTVKSNLDAFRQAANTFVEQLKKVPETDQDFADAEVNIKRCEEAEARLAVAHDGVLSRITSVDEVISAINEVSEMVRAARLNLERLVKAKKDSIKAGILDAANKAFVKYLGKLNDTLGDRLMPYVATDFPGAAKNKRTIKSLQDSVDQELARAKLEANAVFEQIRGNLAIVRGEAHDWGFLFPDLTSVCTKSTEDFANLMAHRVSEHEARVAKERAAAQVPAQEAAPAEVDPLAAAQLFEPADAASQGGETNVVAEEGSRMNLSCINAILAPVSITGAGLAGLGFHPVEIVRGSRLYRASEIEGICAAIARHVMSVSRTAKP